MFQLIPALSVDQPAQLLSGLTPFSPMAPRRGILGVAVRGTAAGLITTGLLAMADGVAWRGSLFGLRTGLAGVTGGGILLMLALAMSLTSYLLARRDRAPGLRRRLLVWAVWSGSAGMSMGFFATALWAAAGRPL